MPVISSYNLTLAEWAKRTDPDGKIPVIANLLNETNPILTDATFVQGNLPTGHRVTVSTGLPTAYWRALNAGIPSSKATTAQVDEGCGILEARSEIDRTWPCSTAIPLSSACRGAHVHRVDEPDDGDHDVLRGRHDRPEELHGFGQALFEHERRQRPEPHPRGWQHLERQSSIYVVCAGRLRPCSALPEGLANRLAPGRPRRTDGLHHGRQRRQPHAGPRRALPVEGRPRGQDWRYAVRIANIEVSQLAGFTGAQELTDYTTNLIHVICKAIARIPNRAMGRIAIYMNRTVESGLMRMALEKNSPALGVKSASTEFGQLGGMTVLGYPSASATQSPTPKASSPNPENQQ